MEESEYLDGGKLYILLVNATEDEQNSYLTLLDKFNSVVKIKDAEFSINDLNSIAENAIKNMDNSIRKGFYIDPRNNQAVITVPQNIVKNQIDSLNIHNKLQYLPITIKEEKDVIPCSLYGGDGLKYFVPSLIYSFTLGVCGTYGGNPAILTAGHDWASNAIVSYQDYEDIGQIVKKQFANNGTGDYAIVQITNTAYPTTNRVWSDSTYYQIKGTLSFRRIRGTG